MAEINQEDIKKWLDERIRALFATRFSHLSPENFTKLVQKTIEYALKGTVPEGTVRVGRGQGGKITNEVRVIIQDLERYKTSPSFRATQGTEEQRRQYEENIRAARDKKKVSSVTSEFFEAGEENVMKEMRAFIKRLLTNMAKEFGGAYSPQVLETLLDDIKQGVFNPEQFSASGAPASAYQPIKEELDRRLYNLEGAKESKIVRLGGEGGFDMLEQTSAREMRAHEARLARLAELEKRIKAVRDLYPKAAERFDKMDSRFLSKEANLKVSRDSFTGTKIIKSSFKDELGVIQQATVVLDKYDDAIATTTNRQASFFQGVARDVREFAKWSVAISLVYLPLQKLQELVDVSIQSQTLLADTIVTLGESQEATNMIFEAAADIANETGESILGVIEGYNLALRAAGDAEDATKRYAVANQLLTDSITLAKLSTLSQAEATDILVAALKQTNLPLDQGQQLLDKWVKVTRVANVDLTTLATSFSIVGEAASKAGLDIDELNGLIALMASQTGLSAKETGNAVRALISGYTSEPVTKELAKFGIAVRNLDGDARDFEAVMEDIRNAFEAGLISESQLNKIAYAIGGGNRRQAQVVTSIVNLSTMNRVAQESAIAQGEAQRALAIELDTVQTKATLLSNTFTQLGQTLGSEGGALAGVSSMISLLNGLAQILTQIIGLSGTAGPVLAALGIGSFLTRGNRGRISGILQSGASGLGMATGVAQSLFMYPAYRSVDRSLPFSDPNLSFSGFATDRARTMATRYQGWMANPANQQALGAGVATALIAGLRAAKGDLEGAGVIVGAGFLTGVLSKSPQFAILGATLASAFVNEVEKTRNLIGRESVSLSGPTMDEELTQEQAIKDIVSQLAEASGRNEWLFSADTAITRFSQQLFGGLWGQDFKLNSTQSAIGLASGYYGVSPERIAEILQSGANRGLAEVLDVDSAYTVLAKQRRDQGLSFESFDFVGALDRTKAGLREEFYDPSNAMSPTEFRNRLEILTGTSATLTNWADALNVAGANAKIFGETTEDAYNQMTKIILYGSQEQIDYINTYVSELTDAFNDLQEYRRLGDTERIESTEATIAELETNFPKLLESTLQQIDLARVTLPSIVRQPELGERGFDIVVKMAEQMNEELENALTEQERLVREANLKNLKALVEIAPGEFRPISEEIADLFDEALSRAKEDNLLPPEASKLGLQKLDITQAQFNETLSMVNSLMPQLEEMGYERADETIITKLNDKQWQDLTTDWTVFNLLLQDILDTEKKQLEGIYNLPANGTFWVPFQAREIEPVSGIDTLPLQNEVNSAGNDIVNAVNNSAALMEAALQKAFSGRTLGPAQDAEFYKYIEDRLMEEDPIYRFSKEDKVPDLANLYSSIVDRWAEDFVPPPPLSDSEQIQEWFRRMGYDTITQNGQYQSEEDYQQDRPQEETRLSRFLSDFSPFVAMQKFLDVLARAGERRYQLQQPQSYTGSNFTPMSGLIGSVPISRSLRDTALSQSTMNVPVSQQKLNLNITSNVNLRLDGRTVANVVKRYLGDSLLRYSTSQGTYTRSVIV